MSERIAIGTRVCVYEARGCMAHIRHNERFGIVCGYNDKPITNIAIGDLAEVCFDNSTQGQYPSKKGFWHKNPETEILEYAY